MRNKQVNERRLTKLTQLMGEVRPMEEDKLRLNLSNGEQASVEVHESFLAGDDILEVTLVTSANRDAPSTVIFESTNPPAGQVVSIPFIQKHSKFFRNCCDILTS